MERHISTGLRTFISTLLLCAAIHTVYSQSLHGQFAVQVAVFERSVPLSHFSGLDKVFGLYHDGQMHYYADGFHHPDEAQVYREEAIALGFSSAEVIATGKPKIPSIAMKASMEMSPENDSRAKSSNESLWIADIYFDPDKSYLKPSGFDRLDELCGLIPDNPFAFIEVTAFSDAKDPAYNASLKSDRLKTVFDYLKFKGTCNSLIVNLTPESCEQIILPEHSPLSEQPGTKARSRRVRIELKVPVYGIAQAN